MANCSRIFRILVSAVLLVQNAVAQNSISFRTYNTADGLPYGTINQIWQDDQGFIWLLAENGLSRFDGFEFISYRNILNAPGSLASSSIYGAFNGPCNQTYFQTSTCISRYNYEEDAFKNLIKYSNYQEVKWLGSYDSTFYCLCKSTLYSIRGQSDSVHAQKLPAFITDQSRFQVSQIDDYLFLSGPDIIARIDLLSGKTVKIPLKLADGSFLQPDQLMNGKHYKNVNTVYLSSYGHLFRLDERQLMYQEIPARACELHELRKLPGSDRVYKDVIYKIVNGERLVELNLKSGEVRFFDFKKIKGLSDHFEPYLIAGQSISDQHIWVAGQSSGILKIDRKRLDPENVEFFHSGNSTLKSNNFNTLLDADPQVIWLYSPGFGLVKGEKKRHFFRSFNPDLKSTNEIPTNGKNVRALYSHNVSTLFAGTLFSGKIIQFQPQFSVEELLPSPVAAITADKNKNLWFSVWGRNALYVLDPFSEKLTPAIPDSGRKLYSENFARALWCGTDNTIYYVNAGKEMHEIRGSRTPEGRLKFLQRSYPLKDVQLNLVFTITGYKEHTLLLGCSTGLFTYDTVSKKIKRFEENKPAAKIFNALDIRSVSLSGADTLWIGTNGNGLFMYVVSTGKYFNYTTETGLADNSIYAILRDKKKNLWMSSNKGIFKLDAASQTTQIFTYKDGIAFEEFNTNAATVFKDGKMAFGGTGGFVVFHPDSILESKIVKGPLLLRFLVNNQPFPLKKAYRLKHNQNFISIQFASLEQFRIDEFSYAYQLEGLDPDWIYCGKQRFTNYVNLQPGEYTLKIKCANYNGRWTDKILRIPVTIEKPWYQTWLFIGFLALIVTGIIYGLFRLRLNQRARLQLIRDSIARDLHDEIGANLSTISIYSEIAKDNLSKKKENVGSLLDKISAYTQMSQESMSDIVWMIDSRNDSFENIIVKMRTLAAETIGNSTAMKLHLNFDEKTKSLKIGMKQRKNLYLIYKESINNIMKYANCANVWIDLLVNEHKVKLIIRDDGQGFDPDSAKGNGLSYMKKRAEELEGEFNIDAGFGKGTTVSLEFRL